MRLDIDWGPCGIDPDGMTALFYPVDGGEPSRFLTNTVTGDEVRLRKGIYNVVVFNQAAEEYSYLNDRRSRSIQHPADRDEDDG